MLAIQVANVPISITSSGVLVARTAVCKVSSCFMVNTTSSVKENARSVAADHPERHWRSWASDDAWGIFHTACLTVRISH